MLDPFSGSGTTGKAALLLGRRYIGYELSKEYYELSIRDLSDTIKEIGGGPQVIDFENPKKKEVKITREPERGRTVDHRKNRNKPDK